MDDKRKIGIFGGAFNPVHNGHINIAKGCLRELELDKIIFIPTANPPHKTAEFLAPESDRINMLKYAIGDNEKFEISDIEFKRDGKSYTYDTLCRLQKIYNNCDFYLIIGADQLFDFHKWYRYKDILSAVTLVSAGRENEKEKEKMLKYAKNLDGLDMNKFYLLKTPVLKVSSSEIREKAKNGEDISQFTDKNTALYIKEKGIYIV